MIIIKRSLARSILKCLQKYKRKCSCLGKQTDFQILLISFGIEFETNIQVQFKNYQDTICLSRQR
jgi:hypothetical protein